MFKEDHVHCIMEISSAKSARKTAIVLTKSVSRYSICDCKFLLSDQRLRKNGQLVNVKINYETTLSLQDIDETLKS